MAQPPPRSRSERLADTHRRLESDVDLWVATADGETGDPYLVPLSFHWDGEAIHVATPVDSVTGRNLARRGRVRLGLGHTRDVVMIDATSTLLPDDDVTPEFGDAFAAGSGFDPRGLQGYGYFTIVPHHVQAWREENELRGRTVMREGHWLT